MSRRLDEDPCLLLLFWLEIWRKAKRLQDRPTLIRLSTNLLCAPVNRPCVQYQVCDFQLGKCRNTPIVSKSKAPVKKYCSCMKPVYLSKQSAILSYAHDDLCARRLCELLNPHNALVGPSVHVAFHTRINNVGRTHTVPLCPFFLLSLPWQSLFFTRQISSCHMNLGIAPLTAPSL